MNNGNKVLLDNQPFLEDGCHVCINCCAEECWDMLPDGRYICQACGNLIIESEVRYEVTS